MEAPSAGWPWAPPRAAPSPGNAHRAPAGGGARKRWVPAQPKVTPPRGIRRAGVGARLPLGPADQPQAPQRRVLPQGAAQQILPQGAVLRRQQALLSPESP